VIDQIEIEIKRSAKGMDPFADLRFQSSQEDRIPRVPAKVVGITM
jgi:hypothetical protein